MAYADLEIYLSSVATANRRDKPYAINTTGTVIDFGGGSSGILDWAGDNNRYAWGAKDGSNLLYYELEVTATNEITVTRTDELGDSTTEVFTGVTPGGTVTDMVHGVSIDLNSSLTIGHIARVYPGFFMLDTAGSFYIERGTAGDDTELKVYNSGTVTHRNSELRVGRAGWYENTSGQAVAGIDYTSDIAIADVYAVTVAANGGNWDITFTGSLNTYTATNIAAGTSAVTWDSGDPGFTFDLDATVTGTDTATVTISDLADALELAADSSGVPGTYTAWSDTTGLQQALNRSGYSDQAIPASTTITVWARINPDVTHPVGRGVARLYTQSFKAE